MVIVVPCGSASLHLSQGKASKLHGVLVAEGNLPGYDNLLLQSFYPWRRIFRDLFVHDRTFGQLFSLRADDPQNHAVRV